MAEQRRRGTAAVAEKPAETDQVSIDGADAVDTAINETGIAPRRVDGSFTIPGIAARFTPTALILPERLSINGWLKVVTGVTNIREGSRWWIGDALNQGEDRYGEKYSQALDATKMEYGSLKNLKSVAKKFAPDRRRSALSWSHHQAVLGLSDEQADEVLRQAEELDWSVMQVRDYIREMKSTTPSTDGAAIPTNGRATVRQTPPAPVAPPVPVVLAGVQPIQDESSLESGTVVHSCDGCDLVFSEPIWHCLGCSGHWGMDVDECQNERCGEPVAVPAVTGQVVESGYLPTETLVSLVTTDFRGADVASAIEYLMSADIDGADDILSALMSAHEWLGRLVESYATRPEPTTETTEDESTEDDDAADAQSVEASDDDTAGDELDDIDFNQDVTDDGSVPVDEEAEAEAAARPLADQPVRAAPKPGAIRKRGQRAAATA